MDKMREEFEAWAINCDLCTFAVGDEYKYMTTEWAWRAWKASRATLCIELPDSWIAGELGDDANVISAVEIMESLEDAGVSYK